MKHQLTHEFCTIGIWVANQIIGQRSVVNERGDKGYVLVEQDAQEWKEVGMTKALPDANLSQEVLHKESIGSQLCHISRCITIQLTGRRLDWTSAA